MNPVYTPTDKISKSLHNESEKNKMSELKKILEIAEKAGSKKIEIWTSSLKIEGELFDDREKIEKGVVSLKNAVISSLAGECNCGDNCTCKTGKYDWFNIFEDRIIAFTII